MGKKPALGHDPLSWIKDTKEGKPEAGEKLEGEKKRESEVSELTASENNLGTYELPKFRTLSPCTVRVSLDQLNFLAALEREIMHNRTKKKERITKNSIIRVAIEIIKELNIDTREIPNEEVLLERAKAKLRTS